MLYLHEHTFQKDNLFCYVHPSSYAWYQDLTSGIMAIMEGEAHKERYNTQYGSRNNQNSPSTTVCVLRWLLQHQATLNLYLTMPNPVQPGSTAQKTYENCCSLYGVKVHMAYFKVISQNFLEGFENSHLRTAKTKNQTQNLQNMMQECSQLKHNVQDSF